VEKMQHILEEIQGLDREIKGYRKELSDLAKEKASSQELKGFGEKVEAIRTSIDAANQKIEDLLKRLAHVESVTAGRKASVDVPGVEPKKFSIAKAVRAILTGDWSKAGYEAEVFRATEDRAKALGITLDSSGGYLLPEEVSSEFISLLRPKVIAGKLGVRFLTGVRGGGFSIPKQRSGATGYWVGENKAITESQGGFGTLKFSPKMAAGLVAASNAMIEMVDGAEEYMRTDLLEALQRLLDLAVFRGTGSEFQPLGIANTANVLTYAMGTNGAAPDYDKINEIVHKPEENDVDLDDGSVGFAFNTKVKRKVLGLKDSNGRPLFYADGAGAGAALARNSLFMGFPWAVSNQLPSNLVKGSSGAVCSEIFFGKFSDVVVPVWSAIALEATRQAGDAFAKHQTWVKAVMMVDVGMRYEKSVCYVRDVLTA